MVYATALLFHWVASEYDLLRLTPMRMRVCRALLFALALPPATLLCQTGPGTVPARTPLTIRVERNTPMRAGEPVSGRLLYPIYADNKLLLPKDTAIRGEVVALRSDHGRRVRAILGGDFTPFHTPVVHFTGIELADGRMLPFASGTTAAE